MRRPTRINKPVGIPILNPYWSQIAGLQDSWYIGDGGWAVNLMPRAGNASYHGIKNGVSPVGSGGYGTGGGYITIPFTTFGDDSAVGWTMRLIGFPVSWPGSYTALFENSSRNISDLFFNTSGVYSFGNAVGGTPTGLTLAAGKVFDLVITGLGASPYTETFYVNGVAQVSSGWSAVSSGSYSFDLGANTSGSGTNPDCVYHLFQTWKRTLSAADAQDLYTNMWDFGIWPRDRIFTPSIQTQIALTADIRAACEFQGGVAIGAANSIEWLPRASIDRGVQGEWGTSSLLDIKARSEWLLGSSGDRGTPSEWLSAALRDILTPDEELSHASVDGNLAGEWTELAFMDAGVPTESLAQAVIDRGVLGDWLGSSLVTSVAPFEFISALVGKTLAPVEFKGEILFVSERAVPLEWLASFLLDRRLPIEALLEAAADRLIAMDWLAPAILDTVLPGEFTASFAGDKFVLTEFEGNIRLISDRILPIEWSVLPAIVRVSLERLLASPSKRRILGTPGRLRLLRRQ